MIHGGAWRKEPFPALFVAPVDQQFSQFFIGSKTEILASSARRRRSPSHTDRFGRPQRRERAAHETIYRGFRLPADLKRGPPEGPSYGLP